MRIYLPEDYTSIIEWCFIRDITEPPRWALPETGLVVDHIAVGFLILTNNRAAILEFFISNPLSDKKMRNEALDEIVLNLIKMAKEAKVKIISCNSQHPAIQERAIKHGFNFIGNYMCFEKGI